MISHSQDSSENHIKALALFLSQITKETSLIKSSDDYKKFPNLIKSLIIKSGEVISSKDNIYNRNRLYLLKKFHDQLRLFANFQFLSTDVKNELCELFKDDNSPCQRFIKNIENFFDSDQDKTRKTLNDALEYYSAIIAKYYTSVIAKQELSPNNTISDEDNLKIFNEIILNSFLKFFGRGDDNPFACIDGTRARLIDAKLALDCPPLYFTIIKEIVDKQVVKTIPSIHQPSHNFHLAPLYFYLLYPDSEEIKKIDSFFRISITNFDLKKIFEFIKQFPEKLKSTTKENIEGLYQNIVSRDNIGSGNYEKFLDYLNQSLLLSEEEKFSIYSFSELDDSYDFKEISQEQSIEKITEKYNLLIQRKFAELFPSSTISLETINYFEDFSCDLFYEDSSIPDPKKIDNLIRLFETPEQFKKGLVILGLILSDYKITYGESDLSKQKQYDNKSEFLELYFNEFLKKFEQQFQLNFIDQLSSIDPKNPQYENIKLILDFYSKKIDFSINPFFAKYCQIFHLGIAKTPSDVEKFSLSQDQILSTLKLQETQLNLKKEFPNYLIKYHQEALLEYFFKSNEFELTCDEFYELLKKAFILKNFDAILTILNITSLETRKELIEKHLVNLIHSAINFSSNEALKDILEFFSQDSLINSLKENLDKHKLNLFSYFAQYSSNPSILSSLTTKFQELGIAIPDINCLLKYQNYPHPETFLSILIKKESYELFKIFFESYLDEDLIDDQGQFKLSKRIHTSLYGNLSLLEIACQFNQPEIFGLIFEKQLKLQRISPSQIIEQQFTFSGITFNLLTFALYHNSHKTFQRLTDYYDNKEQLLRILLETKIAFGNSSSFNMLEFCCSRSNEKIFKIILDVYKNHNQTDVHPAEIKVLYKQLRISLLSLAILEIKRNNTSLFENLITDIPEDKLINLLFEKFSINNKEYSILQNCLIAKPEIFLIVLNRLKLKSINLKEIFLKKLNTEDNQFNLLSMACIKIINSNSSQNSINAKMLKTIADIFDKDELLDFFSNIALGRFKISDDSEDVDFITLCCLKKNSNLLEEIINLIPEEKLVKFFKKYLETPQNAVFSFLRESPKLACLILVQAIKDNDTDFLKTFLDGYDLESESTILSLQNLLFQRFEEKKYNDIYDRYSSITDEPIKKHDHSLLTVACFLNKTESIEILLKKCPHQFFDDFINIRLNNPSTLNAIALSIRYGDIESIKKIFGNLPQDYDIKKILDQKFGTKETSLEFIAAAQKNFDAVEFLIKKKLEIETKTEIDQYKIFSKLVSLKDKNQHTILYCAIYNICLDTESNNQNKFIEFFSKLTQFLTAFEIQEYINTKDPDDQSSVFDLSLSKNCLDFAKQLILSGSFITKPSEDFIESEKDYSDNYNLNKFHERIYQILREIRDEEISPEKITNPITFSNLLLLKAIADLEELSEEQKIATIDKLIEETNQDKSLVDMVIEGYQTSNLLDPDQSEQGKFIEKELLNELAVKIRNALNSSLIKRKRGFDDTQTPELLKKLKEESRKTPNEEEGSSIESAYHNTKRFETSSRNSPSPLSPKGEAMTDRSYQRL